MTKPIFSIIIPVRQPNSYLRETIRKLKKQSFKKYELLVITDKISQQYSRDQCHLGPSFKRNLGAKLARGKFLAFIDDDSYPHRHWLKNALESFSKSDISAVCGPSLIPKSDSVSRRASGLFWSTFLGSGGAGSYRNKIANPRFVDDFPSVNFIVRRSDFNRTGGFNTDYWPGEDTLLCLAITHRLKKKIYYDPKVIVYHHRRPVVIPHLKQISRYAISRGHFAKKFPKTSLRPGYLLPSLFLLYVLLLPFLYHQNRLFLLPLAVYITVVILTFFQLLIQKNSLPASLLAVATIPITHLYYGLMFVVGFSKKSLKFTPHQVNQSTGEYVGG